MLFNSPEFIFIFLPASLVAFLATGRLFNAPVAVATLVAASIVFYAVWRVDDLLLLTASVAANYAAGQGIRYFIDSKRTRSARLMLIAGIAFNVGLIAYFKYLDFLVGIVHSLVGAEIHGPKVTLPLGISFFTFTQITFLVDVYRRQTFEANPLRYALFVTFFPHLIAGPILHQSMMGPQFQHKGFGRVSVEEFCSGLLMFVAGFCKKVLVADPIGSYAGPVFAAAAVGGPMTFWEAWAGVLAYTMQIYFDFSGYSDMAVGLGLMFGVRLPVNFNSPYKAVNIVDFWRRWHMTLSGFLRDYLYIPLGGNRYGALLRYRNLLLTMLLGGLWHGANWTFVLWGGLHGVMICINHAWQMLPIPAFPLPSMLRTHIAQAVTFLSVAICWVPFRADSFATTIRMWRIMAGIDGVPLASPLAGLLGRPAANMFGHSLLGQGSFWLFEVAGISERTVEGIGALALLYGICVFLPNTQEIMHYDPNDRLRAAVEPGYLKRPMLVGSVVALAFWICIFSLSQPTQFLYFNF